MKERGNKKQLVGIIASDKMDKTVIVRVESVVQHKLYKKYIKRHRKFAAHDEKNECGIGDKVLIIESRPISKTKKFRVSKIVEKAVLL